MNQVLETETLSKLYEACDYQEQRWIDKIKDQLQQNVRVGSRYGMIGSVKKSWRTKDYFI